jgi:ABC-type spermidine/putrescine transport system permease subunit II
MEHVTKLIGKVRPQIFLALSILGVIAYIGVQESLTEVTVGCIAGIIALAKDVLQSDA